MTPETKPPIQGEKRTNKDGTEDIYMIDAWVPVNGKRSESKDDTPKLDCEIRIGDKLVLIASARFKTFEKSGRKGVRIDLKPNQDFWGSGNFMLKSK